MTETGIDYANLMHRALRGLVQDLLRRVAAEGLPGSHHFFITFDTMHPDVEIADWLSDRYPGEMTIVIQHWFENLEVGDDGFSVTLNFGDAAEPLYIPYKAIRTFVDPSVNFGLRLETRPDEAAEAETGEDEAEAEAPETAPPPGPKPRPRAVPDDEARDGKKGDGKKEADIVSLDKFRK